MVKVMTYEGNVEFTIRINKSNSYMGSMNVSRPYHKPTRSKSESFNISILKRKWSEENGSFESCTLSECMDVKSFGGAFQTAKSKELLLDKVKSILSMIRAKYGKEKEEVAQMQAHELLKSMGFNV